MYALIIVCLLILLYVVFKPDVVTLALVGLSAIVVLSLLHVDTTGGEEHAKTRDCSNKAYEYSGLFNRSMVEYIQQDVQLQDDKLAYRDAKINWIQGDWYNQWWYAWTRDNLGKTIAERKKYMVQITKDAHNYFDNMYKELLHVKLYNPDKIVKLLPATPENIRVVFETANNDAQISTAVRTYLSSGMHNLKELCGKNLFLIQPRSNPELE